MDEILNLYCRIPWMKLILCVIKEIMKELDYLLYKHVMKLDMDDLLLWKNGFLPASALDSKIGLWIFLWNIIIEFWHQPIKN